MANNRITRGVEKVQQFGIGLDHVRGDKNKLADILSRHCHAESVDTWKKNEFRMRAEEIGPSVWKSITRRIPVGQRNYEELQRLIREYAELVTSKRDSLS